MPTAGSTRASSGYDAVADAFMLHRETSRIGLGAVLEWSRQLRPGGDLLDLGCGSGKPLAIALDRAGFRVYGVDASPRLVAAFRGHLPEAPVACESIETSDFFDRHYDGVLAIGLVFLLHEAAQRTLIDRVARVLHPGGRFLFTAPAQDCVWTDVLTGERSRSLGAGAYERLIGDAGLQLAAQFTDEGGNHYFDTLARAAEPTRPLQGQG